MHVIVAFSALLLNVLINFDNEIIIFRGEKENNKKLLYGTRDLNLQDKSIVDHAKAICSRNFTFSFMKEKCK